MKIQTIELEGRRFVILPEEDFRTLEREAHSAMKGLGKDAAERKSRFSSVTPIKVSGVLAS